MLIMDDDEFIIKIKGQNAARLQFARGESLGIRPDLLIIKHTVVFDDFEGHGYGRQLIYALVDYAREHKKVIEPQCPFAKAIFAKTLEIQDVLVK